MIPYKRPKEDARALRVGLAASAPLAPRLGWVLGTGVHAPRRGRIRAAHVGLSDRLRCCSDTHPTRRVRVSLRPPRRRLKPRRAPLACELGGRGLGARADG